ncbi:MAG: glycosyltransferase, partial [Nitrososphaeria archaeon]
MDEPFVSVIIPCKSVDKMTKECINGLKNMDYTNFEIIVLPDNDDALEGAIVIPTGPVTPGRKRNIGAANAKGTVFAYIDSDAYPARDWIKNGIKHLIKGGVGLVTGPAVTPPNDGRFSQAQGVVL